MTQNNKKSRGFTLIEILIVIAMIAILTTIIIAYLSAAKTRGRDAKRIADIKQMEQLLEVYFSSCYAYPNSLSQLTTDCSGNTIIVAVPKDPKGTQYSYYVTNNSPVHYHVCATLELSASGTGKSGQSNTTSGISGDQCNGVNGNVYDRYGP